MKTSTITTLLGSGAGATEFAMIDFPLLMHGDATQIGHVVKALFLVAWAYYTNRKGTVGSTVPVGTLQSAKDPLPEGNPVPTQQKP